MTTPIQARRRALNMTQEELARAAGVQLSALQKQERGAVLLRNVRAGVLASIARVLGCTVEDLLNEETQSG